MSPLELWCNEAQERFVLTLTPSGLARFCAIAQRERCPFAVIGQITDDGELIVHDSKFGDEPVHMPIDALLGKTPQMRREVRSRHRAWAPSIVAGSMCARRSIACCACRPWPTRLF